MGRFYANFSNDLGFTGISIGLLAANNPIGVLIFCHLFRGAEQRRDSHGGGNFSAGGSDRSASVSDDSHGFRGFCDPYLEAEENEKGGELVWKIF